MYTGRACGINSVYRKGVWYKLIILGCTGKMLNIIRNLYSKIKCCVKGHNGLTDFFLTLLGLQQGAILSPYLFALFINDLVDIILQNAPNMGINVHGRDISLMMYADDMILISDEPENLQILLNVLYEYCETWKLNVNLNKSNILVCNNGNRAVDREWYYGDNVLELCHVYTYLGVLFTDNGVNNNSINVLCNQAKKSLAVLMSNLASYGEFPPHVYLRLFHVSISPILCYASEVWGYLECRSHQVLQNKFCKRILGVKDTTPNCAVSGELGQYPINIHRQISMVKYWCKIVTGPRDRYRYIMYRYLFDTVDVNLAGRYRNWAVEVRNILISVGLAEIWRTEILPYDVDRFLGIVKQSLIDLFINDWYREMFSKDKLYTYRLYKNVFGFEMYLYVVTSSIIRKTLARLRMSSHSLEIERGRYPPRVLRHRRFCRQCNINEMEDEFHFMLICEKYYQLRLTYIPQAYWTRPSMAKYLELMNLCSENHVMCTNISLYTYKAMKIRNN